MSDGAEHKPKARNDKRREDATSSPVAPLRRMLQGGGGRIQDPEFVVPRIQRHLDLHPEGNAAPSVHRKIFRAESNDQGQWEALAEREGAAIGTALPTDAEITAQIMTTFRLMVGMDENTTTGLTAATARELAKGDLKDFLQTELTSLVKTTPTFGGFGPKNGVTDEKLLTSLQTALGQSDKCNDDAVSRISGVVIGASWELPIVGQETIKEIVKTDVWCGKKSDVTSRIRQKLTDGGVTAQLDSMTTLAEMAAEDEVKKRVEAFGTDGKWAKTNAAACAIVLDRMKALRPKIVEDTTKEVAKALKPREALRDGVTITRYEDKHLKFLNRELTRNQAIEETGRGAGQYWVDGAKLSLDHYHGFVKATLENGDEFEGDSALKIYDGSCAGISGDTQALSTRHRAEVSGRGESHGHPH